tara:strand:- start:121 stop:543 length:423 start_codon:yes stop_codon:yes gene_type:complete
MQERKLNVVFTSVVLVTSLFLFLSSDKVADTVRSFNNGFDNSFSECEDDCGCSTEDITNMYADYIEEWKLGVSQAFDKAEHEIYGEDEIVGPHPDPKKCVCGGSGIIVHGDGHKTVCPYHGKKKEMNRILIENNLIYKPL